MEDLTFSVADLGAPAATGDLASLCTRLASMLETSDVEFIECDVGGLMAPDAAMLDGLARLQLTARRLGYEMRLRNASDELHDLLALAGMCDIVGLCCDSPDRRRSDLVIQARGQAEEREHSRRVEEERDSADPITGKLQDLE